MKTLAAIVLLATARGARAADATIQTVVIPLRENWDDAVGWDITETSQRAYPNPSSNPWAEILIGDASTHYQMSNIRTYFRFKLDLPQNPRIVGARILFHCSASGSTTPKLDIRAVESPEPSFQGDPRTLPLSASSVPWENEENDWVWEAKADRQYNTPDLSALVRDFVAKYGPTATIGFVILNRPGNKDNFKGIISFDDGPQLSARLEIDYR